MDDLRTRKRIQAVIAYRETKKLIFNILGRECTECGFDNINALQIDHIYGGGEKHRKKYGGTSQNYYKDILKDPDIKKKYQILCANCNFIKLRESKEYERSKQSYKSGTGQEVISPDPRFSSRQLTLQI